MLVEFIGISGSGKSTAASLVARLLQAEGTAVRHIGSGYEWVEGSRLRARLGDVMAAGTGRAFDTYRLARVVKGAGHRLRLKEQLSLLSLLGQNMRALEVESGLVLSDQGLLQRLGSFALRCDEASRFFDQLEADRILSLPWPHRVLFFQLDPGVAFARVKARGGRVARIGDEELQNLLARSLMIVEAQAELAERLGIPVERVSADSAPDVLAQRVAAQLAHAAGSGA